MKHLFRIAVPFLLVLLSTPLFAQAPAEPATPAAQLTFDITGPKLRVANLDRSIKFYTQDLGLTLSRRISNRTAVIASSGKAPPPLILLIQDDKPITVGDGLFAMMINVGDPVALRARLNASGYATPDEGSPGVFLVKDPDGYTVEVTSARPPTSRP